MIQHFYAAYCSNRNDPEKRGRIKARCPGMLNSAAELPEWICPLAPKFGELDVPEINELIELVVDQTDEQYDHSAGETFHRGGGKSIKWRQVPHTTSAGKLRLPALLREDYPHRRGIVSRRGHWFFVNDNPDERKQLNSWGHRKGHRIDQHADGSITIHATDGSTIQLLTTEGAILVQQAGGAKVQLTPAALAIQSADGSYINMAAGFMQIVSSGQVNVTGAAINLSSALVAIGASAAGDEKHATIWEALKDYIDAQIRNTYNGHRHGPGTFSNSGGSVAGLSGAPDAAMSVALPVSAKATESKIS